jgi:hypothetical protein
LRRLCRPLGRWPLLLLRPGRRVLRPFLRK